VHYSGIKIDATYGLKVAQEGRQVAEGIYYYCGKTLENCRLWCELLGLPEGCRCHLQNSHPGSLRTAAVAGFREMGGSALKR
jgi:hypothetical protein